MCRYRPSPSNRREPAQRPETKSSGSELWWLRQPAGLHISCGCTPVFRDLIRGPRSGKISRLSLPAGSPGAFSRLATATSGADGKRMSGSGSRPTGHPRRCRSFPTRKLLQTRCRKTDWPPPPSHTRGRSRSLNRHHRYNKKKGQTFRSDLEEAATYSPTCMTQYHRRE